MNMMKILQQLFQPGTSPWGFRFLKVEDIQLGQPAGGGKIADALLRLKYEKNGRTKNFVFIIETKSQNTPKAVDEAIRQVKAMTKDTERWPMVVVPYLSNERMDMLDIANVSGIDLCGNGIIITDHCHVSMHGAPNKYPASRGAQNVFTGKSSLVCHQLLHTPCYDSLNDLHQAIANHGGELSLSQVSKVVHVLVEELIVRKQGRKIELIDAYTLLTKLSNAYRQPIIRFAENLRLAKTDVWMKTLNGINELKWSVIGTSSIKLYGGLAENGPIQVAVNDLDLATKALNDEGATREHVQNFADITLRLRENEPSNYFNNTVDKTGIRWASQIQTYLELQAGDARQQDAAVDLLSKILIRIQNATESSHGE